MPYLGYEPSKVAVTVGQGVIDATHIQDASITTADLGNDSVTPIKIDDDGTGFQMGSLGLGTAVSGSEKLTVGGTASFSGNITGNLVGNVTGNTSGTAATVTGATQSAITSVGTLSSLTLSGDLTLPQKIVHSGDTDTYLSFGDDSLSLYTGGTNVIDFIYGNIYIKQNNKAVVGYNSSGSAKELIKIDGSNVVQIAEGSNSNFGGWVYVNNRVMGASGDIRVGSNDGNEMLHLLANGTARIDTAGSSRLEIDEYGTVDHKAGRYKLGGHWMFEEVSDQKVRIGEGMNNGLEIFQDMEWYGEGKAKIENTAGSQSTPTYSFNSDTDTGMYRGAANVLCLATGGTERLEITNSQVKATGNLINVGYAETRITSNNTGHDFKLNADTNYVNSLDSFFDGASAASSFMRVKVASGAGTQNTVVTMTGDGLATFAGGVAINGASIGSHKLVVDNGTTSLNRGNTGGDILDVRGLNTSHFKVTTSGARSGHSATSVANGSWTNLSGLTNLSAGLYMIHVYKDNYAANDWSARGIVEATGHSTIDGDFENQSGFQLRVDGSNVQLYHTLGQTFGITARWLRIG